MNPATQALCSDLHDLRAQAPLVHNITNFVVMNTTANALLALGASPVMAHAPEEVEDMVGLARALVLNLGTLTEPWVESMLKAGLAARRRGVPIVLDPVGCGATRYRTETSRRLLEALAPTIVRGNASEILALAGGASSTRGVDSADPVESAAAAARELAGRSGCVVAISGAVDCIVSPGQMIRVHNGHAWMPRVTGLGCTASALTGAFAAVSRSPLLAAAHALAVNGIAGEMAAEHARGPGTFQVAFLDALFTMDDRDVERRLRLEIG